MTKPQKIIIAILSTVAILILSSLICAVIFLVSRGTASNLLAVPTAVAQEPPPTPMPTSASTPVPAATATPTLTALPSPTGTPVVTLTVLPTPTPTRANCVNDVTSFEDSGVITDEEVKQYLRETIPINHLDGCRGIEYFHQAGALHGTPIAGSIVPIYREIQVFAVDPENQTAALILDTLTHEIGHNVHKNIRVDNIEIDMHWAKLHRQSQETFADNGLGFVSDYARTDKFEDFAETYMAYVRYSELLRFSSPTKYEFMRLEVFAGLEYPP